MTLEIAVIAFATAAFNIVYTVFVCDKLEKLEDRVDKLNVQVWKKG